MARSRTLFFLPFVLFAALSFTLVACGDDDDADGDSPTPTSTVTPTPGDETPGTPTAVPATPIPTLPPAVTITPTPDAQTDAGFVLALEQFNKELNAGVVDPIIARVQVREYTCKASDVAGGEGAVGACKSEGEVLKTVATSTWRSSGNLTRVEDFVANLQGLQANFDTSKSDEFGPGTFRVLAYDEQKHAAVLTVTSNCLPNYKCPDAGFQRLVWLAEFEYDEARWKIKGLMYAFVLGEEFLAADGEGSKIYLPGWKAFE